MFRRFICLTAALALLMGMQAAATERDSLNLVFIGNSITAGATLSDRAAQAPPVVCGELVQQATGTPTKVFNGGHSGITTLGFLPGRADFQKVCNAASSLLKANSGRLYFSIMLGTNDSACSGTEGAPVSTDTYRANMKAIIDELLVQFPACRILVNYPIWYSPNTHNGARYLEEGLQRLHSYYAVIDTLVQEHAQVFGGNRSVWEIFEDNTALFTAENGNSGTFFLHPNADGAARLAEVWARSLIEILEAEGERKETDSGESKKPREAGSPQNGESAKQTATESEQ